MDFGWFSICLGVCVRHGPVPLDLLPTELPIWWEHINFIKGGKITNPSVSSCRCKTCPAQAIIGFWICSNCSTCSSCAFFGTKLCLIREFHALSFHFIFICSTLNWGSRSTRKKYFAMQSWKCAAGVQEPIITKRYLRCSIPIRKSIHFFGEFPAFLSPQGTCWNSPRWLRPRSCGQVFCGIFGANSGHSAFFSLNLLQIWYRHTLSLSL